MSNTVRVGMLQDICICLFRPKTSQLCPPPPPTSSTERCNRNASFGMRDDIKDVLSISLHLSQALLVQANMLASRKFIGNCINIPHR